MRVVLDFNIAFSALYSKGSAYKLFSMNHVLRSITFVVPEYFWEEFSRLLPRAKQLGRLRDADIEVIRKILSEQIVTIPRNLFENYLEEALNVSTDPKDAPYVALAMALDVPLLTGDKKLAESVKGRVKVLTLRDALELV